MASIIIHPQLNVLHHCHVSCQLLHEQLLVLSQPTGHWHFKKDLLFLLHFSLKFKEEVSTTDSRIKLEMRWNSAEMRLALCVLFIGFQGGHAELPPVNTCIPGEDDCDEQATCQESALSEHTCVCKDGYSGNGVTSCVGE